MEPEINIHSVIHTRQKMMFIPLQAHWLEQDKSQSHSKSIQSFVHSKVAMTACTCYIAKKNSE